MSNALAIAAVTATLRNMIELAINDEGGIPGTTVTTNPPDKARVGDTNQMNLFLYHTGINASWRNQTIPQQVKGGETGLPPLGLDLYYLLTAYGQNNDDLISHQLLAKAMQFFHDNAVLSPSMLQLSLAGSDLYKQVERIRITLQPLTIDEMSKLWTTFQTQYRISTAYQVSVVLIESAKPVKTALPVLTRGSNDTGYQALANLLPPYPQLTSIKQEKGDQPAAQLGDTLVLRGFNLDGDSAVIRFMNPHLPAAILRDPEPGGTANEVHVIIPDDPLTWVAGFYTIAIEVTKAKIKRVTNELTYALAPKMTNTPVNNVQRDGNSTATLTIQCTPQVQPDQRVALLLDDLDIPAQPHAIPTATLQVIVKNASAGSYRVRLRVDGVDSLFIDYAALVITVSSEHEIQPDQEVVLEIDKREMKAQPHEIPTNTVQFIIEKPTAGSTPDRLLIDGTDTKFVYTFKQQPVFKESEKVSIV